MSKPSGLEILKKENEDLKAKLKKAVKHAKKKINLDQSVKIKKNDRFFEKDIVIGMITSTPYLARLKTIFEPEYLRSELRFIAMWCFEYYEQTQEAPKRLMENIFESKRREKGITDEQFDHIEKTLERLNEYYENKEDEEFNLDYYISKAENYFNKVKVELAIQDAETDLCLTGPEDALQTLRDAASVKLTGNKGLEPMQDDAVDYMRDGQTEKSLFLLDGDFGLIMNEYLTRSSFIAIQAPEKTGKTWFLNWFAREALKNRLKVVVIQAGDMSDKQTMERMAITNCKKSNKAKYCGEFKNPVAFVSCDDEGTKQCKAVPEGFDLEYEMIDVGLDPINSEDIKSSYSKFCKKYRVKRSNLKLFSFASNTVNMTEINIILENLERENFVADVLLVDYMDILKAENLKEEGTRDRLNSNWMQANSVSKQRRLLLISATQASAKSYDGAVQDRTHFSEDKRKSAHVSGILWLNQTPEERECGIMKAGWVLARDGYYSSQPCYIAQCLRRGLPVVDSLLVASRKKNPVIEKKVKKDKKKASKRKRRR